MLAAEYSNRALLETCNSSFPFLSFCCSFCCDYRDYHVLQEWLETPFRSRRNIVLTMLFGSAAVWVWNKSEECCDSNNITQ